MTENIYVNNIISFEVKQENEPNIYQIDVDEHMNTDDVFLAAQKILKMNTD